MWRHGALIISLVAFLWLQLVIPLANAEMFVVEPRESVKRTLERESGPETSFAQSLTRDFLFFLTFVGQVILFLIFFWEKPTTTKRWNVGEEAAVEERTPRKVNREIEVLVEDRAVASSSEQRDEVPTQVPQVNQAFIAPPEGSRATNEEGRASTQLDDAFEPLESTIRDLQHRISGLERTLNRRKGNYPTESLKTRLRDCISTITGTLARLEDDPVDQSSHADLDPSTSPNNRIDITRWPLESSKRQLELQLEQLEAGIVMRDPLLDKSPSSQALDHSSPKEDIHSILATDSLPSKPKSSLELTSTELPDRDLDLLAAQLIGPKKGRKGGKVKISTRDLSTLQFLAEATDPSAEKSELHKTPEHISEPIVPEANIPLSSDEDATARVILATEQSQTTESTSVEPSDSVETEVAPVAIVDANKGEEDELADLARLMSSAPKRNNKNKNKSKPSAAPVPTQTGPANIFNMFSPLSQEDTSVDREISEQSPTTSPRSISPPPYPEHDPTDDLLAQLEGFKSNDKHDDMKDLLSGLGDFSMPDMSIPEDFDMGEVDSSTADLLAALNAASTGQSGGDNDEGSDFSETSEEASDGEEDSNEATSEEENDEFEATIALERPVISAFSASEALNRSGLQRAKKKVALTKDGKKGTYQMEDFHFCEFPWEKENWGLFCIMDGHSGKDCAEMATKLIPKHLKANLQPIDLEVEGGVDLTDIFTKTFLDADKELEEFEYEGSTCTVVFIYKTSSGHRYIQSANVGDSSAVLIRNEKAVVLTTDHHPNYPSEIERLTKMGIEFNPGQTRLNGLAVSRALGDHFPKSTECGIIAAPTVSSPIKLRGTDSHVIIASDGLWDVITFQTAYDIIKDMDSASEMSDALLKTATRSSKCTDNVTTVVVQL